MKLLDFFQKAYVINLPERIDRQRLIQKELSKIGMQFTPGKLELFPGIRPTEAAGFSSLGARGCLLSHLQILRQAHHEGLTNVLIMEDDLFIDYRFKQVEADLLAQLSQQDWGFVYFGYLTNLPVTFPVQLIPTQAALVATHCYGVNASVFERLIHFLESIQQRSPGDPDGGPMHLDGAYSFFRQHNPDVITLKASSVLIAQQASRSDVAPNAWYDHLPLTRSLVATLRSSKTAVRSLRNRFKPYP